ncbi:MAG: TetR/AcrR family transcriptional regulator [Arthrobacter sp.]|jgi:AcrR family transcriptional regulator|nr:TetR/AcrR family transcriptional regulator [Arthrobacter sp.]
MSLNPTTSSSSTAPPPSLRERQRRRTREDLVASALDVVGRVGLEEATVARITQAAGTSRATLYAHFPEGRTQLLAEAYQVLGRRVLEGAKAHRDRAEGWVERIAASLTAMLEVATVRELGLFYNVSGPHLMAGRRRGVGSQATLEVITLELEKAQARHQVREGLDAGATAALLVGAIREAGIDAAQNPALAQRHHDAFAALVGALGA